MIEYILLAVIAGAVYLAISSDPPPIAGYYNQPGKFYYFKYVAFLFLFKLRSLRKSNSSETGQTAGYGVKSKSSIADMEQVQPLPDVKQHPMAVDAVYFAQSNSDGFYLVTATARRQNGMIQILTYLKVPDVGLFELPLHPETLSPESEKMSYSTAGLTITPVLPMQQWNVSFDGMLRHSDTGKLHKVKFHLVWKAVGPYFDFDTDMNIWVTCDTMATEKWSKAWFDELKTRHQTHHEQFGVSDGKLDIEGYGTYDLKMRGLRDHSYGNIREWRDLFRYGIQYICLDDGTNLALGNICIPKLMSRLTMGYVISPDGRLDSVSWTDFQFYEWGDDGNHPQELAISFCAGGKDYKMTCSVVCAPQFYMRDKKADGNWPTNGSDADDCSHGAKLFERMCTFTVNGVRGTGISEWCYENIPRHNNPVASEAAK